MFKTLIVALAAVAAAVPTWPHEGNNVGNNCGNGAEVHCCNSNTVKELTGGGLLNNVDAQNLLGQCNKLNVPIIDVVNAADILNNKCSQQVVCCNKVEQNGLVNVGCTPLNL
ncbi:hypothetical protein ED733_001506 [Metarhizium rileyi]|uniref:Hydrophobin n=1 Tax=Metarhizium rileyi (strain RCEF 4871) TaxID=1649241 RepID=A0A5C6G3A0_METRR|nr:hypothetical protein ED733_001506 [Metarhizium rileyi]